MLHDGRGICGPACAPLKASAKEMRAALKSIATRKAALHLGLLRTHCRGLSLGQPMHRASGLAVCDISAGLLLVTGERKQLLGCRALQHRDVKSCIHTHRFGTRFLKMSAMPVAGGAATPHEPSPTCRTTDTSSRCTAENCKLRVSQCTFGAPPRRVMHAMVFSSCHGIR